MKQVPNSGLCIEEGDVGLVGVCYEDTRLLQKVSKSVSGPEVWQSQGPPEGLFK